jgi:hypothetical protein
MACVTAQVVLAMGSLLVRNARSIEHRDMIGSEGGT